jgi:hypothetical protein
MIFTEKTSATTNKVSLKPFKHSTSRTRLIRQNDSVWHTYFKPILLAALLVLLGAGIAVLLNIFLS